MCHTVFPDVKIHFLFTGKGEKSRISSISLGLPELPSGVKRTRAFTYNKRNYQNFDLTIGRYHQVSNVPEHLLITKEITKTLI